MVERTHLDGTWQRARTFSPAVVTKGGQVVWVAGHGANRNEVGDPFDGDFAAQARQCFQNMQATLARSGAGLADLVTMTVFITDTANGAEFVKIRAEFFEDGKWPASALITCAGLAHPSMQVEIQGIAVIDE